MATSERDRQKRLEKKAQKRKLAKKAAGPGAAAGPRSSAGPGLPVHECLVPSDLFEGGIGTVLISRRQPDGELAVSAFLVDVFCLGVKDAFFTRLSDERYEKLKATIPSSSRHGSFEHVHQACAKKLITGAVHYAEDLGFAPHRDYRGALRMLSDIDASACPERFTFGSNGMPFYIRGPNESAAQAKRIVERLAKRCGAGNFHYLVGLEEQPLFDD